MNVKRQLPIRLLIQVSSTDGCAYRVSCLRCAVPVENLPCSLSTGMPIDDICLEPDKGGSCQSEPATDGSGTVLKCKPCPTVAPCVTEGLACTLDGGGGASDGFCCEVLGILVCLDVEVCPIIPAPPQTCADNCNANACESGGAPTGSGRKGGCIDVCNLHSALCICLPRLASFRVASFSSPDQSPIEMTLSVF